MVEGAKKQFMLLGAIGSGKTSLLRSLEGQGQVALKTQMIDYAGWGIDTPGEYAEMGAFRERLRTVASDADSLLVIQDATRNHSCFPPNYLLMFPQQTLGAITKVDMPNSNVERAMQLLRESGVRGEIFTVSALTGEGIEDLKQYLLLNTLPPAHGVNEYGKCSR